MARAPRFIIRVSDSSRPETAWTHSKAWLRSLQLYRPGLIISCLDTDPPTPPDEERPAAPAGAGLNLVGVGGNS